MSLSSYRAAPLRDTNRFNLPAKDSMERVKGVEPSSLGWKPRALPLSYTRVWKRPARGPEGLSFSPLLRILPPASVRTCCRSPVLPCLAPPCQARHLDRRGGFRANSLRHAPQPLARAGRTDISQLSRGANTALHDPEGLCPPLLRFRMPRWTGFPVPLPPSHFRKGRGISPYYSESGECFVCGGDGRD